MKRVGFVYDKLLDKEFIKQTIIKASKHKTSRKAVKKVLANLDYYTDLIYEMIKNDEIKLKPTRQREILERGKVRKITISPFFPNQIFDYLLVECTKPIIRKSMYHYCVGNVDKRGISYGMKYGKKIIKKYNYFMKLDIRHFYENVSPNLLIAFFERKIKDKRFIEFMRKVIDKKELPIGTYYSQWFSNYFLYQFDHFVKEELRTPAYIRNVDDMVFGGNNRKSLKSAYHRVKRYLMNMKLELKYRPNIKTKLNFLGYIFTKQVVKLRLSIFYRIQRTIKKMRKHICFSLVKRFISYIGWIKSLDIGYAYYKNNVEPIIKIGKLKRMVSQGGI